MRRRALLLPVAALVAACDVPQRTLAPADSPSDASFTEHSVARTSWSLGRWSSCTGDYVTLAGTLTLLLHRTLNERGEWLVMHGTLSNLRGIGSPSNTRYVGTDAETSVGTLTPGADGYVRTMTNLLVSQGGAPNLLLHVTWRVTLGPSGDPVVLVENIITECVGGASS